MVGEKPFKHLVRGVVCGHAKVGRIQDFFFDFVYLLFIFISFFYYFENIEEENNIIISYDHYDHHDHQFQKK
jgi:hypothetical protein